MPKTFSGTTFSMTFETELLLLISLCLILVLLVLFLLMQIRAFPARVKSVEPQAVEETGVKEFREVNLRENAGSSEIEKLSMLVEELRKTRKELEDQKEMLEEALLLVEKDNFRKTEELWEAQQLQLSMLPRQTPFYPGYEISLFSQPATEVGGDYYDFSFEEKGKRLHLVLGDATGHGYKPGILVATAKSYFQTLSGKNKPEEVLERISEAILSLNTRGLYMGLSLLRIDGDLIELVSSGMPPVLYYQPAEGKEKVQQHSLKGLFLGVTGGQSGSRKYFRMHSGDVLLLMTDGLAEGQNEAGELFGYESVRKVFAQNAQKGARNIIEKLMEAGKSWRAGKEGFKDDVSLMVIKRK